MRLIVVFAVYLMLILPTNVWSQDDLGLDLQIRMTTVKNAGPPEILHRTVLLSYQSRNYVRYVGAAFDFEDFQRIHVFKRNKNGVFLLPFSPPRNLESITYRLVVDGLWIPDPRNPDVVSDERGNKLSYLSVSLPPERILRSPIVAASGNVRFIIKHKPGARVYLAGDFTNWEPFMIRMPEGDAGVYSVSLRLSPGQYEYCYIVEGLRVLDPLNPSYGADSHGYLASHFTVSR